MFYKKVSTLLLLTSSSLLSASPVVQKNVNPFSTFQDQKKKNNKEKLRENKLLSKDSKKTVGSTDDSDNQSDRELSPISPYRELSPISPYKKKFEDRRKKSINKQSSFFSKKQADFLNQFLNFSNKVMFENKDDFASNFNDFFRNKLASDLQRSTCAYRGQTEKKFLKIEERTEFDEEDLHFFTVDRNIFSDLINELIEFYKNGNSNLAAVVSEPHAQMAMGMFLYRFAQEILDTLFKAPLYESVQLANNKNLRISDELIDDRAKTTTPLLLVMETLKKMKQSLEQTKPDDLDDISFPIYKTQMNLCKAVYNILENKEGSDKFCKLVHESFLALLKHYTRDYVYSSYDKTTTKSMGWKLMYAGMSKLAETATGSASEIISSVLPKKASLKWLLEQVKEWGAGHLVELGKDLDTSSFGAHRDAISEQFYKILEARLYYFLQDDPLHKGKKKNNKKK